MKQTICIRNKTAYKNLLNAFKRLDSDELNFGKVLEKIENDMPNEIEDDAKQEEMHQLNKVIVFAQLTHYNIKKEVQTWEKDKRLHWQQKKVFLSP